MRNTLPVYDPIDGKNENYDLWPQNVNAPPSDVLLTNILLELRVLTKLFLESSPGMFLDSPESLRADEATSMPPSVPNSVNFS